MPYNVFFKAKFSTAMRYFRSVPFYKANNVLLYILCDQLHPSTAPLWMAALSSHWVIFWLVSYIVFSCTCKRYALWYSQCKPIIQCCNVSFAAHGTVKLLGCVLKENSNSSKKTHTHYKPHQNWANPHIWTLLAVNMARRYYEQRIH